MKVHKNGLYKRGDKTDEIEFRSHMVVDATLKETMRLYYSSISVIIPPMIDTFLHFRFSVTPTTPTLDVTLLIYLRTALSSIFAYHLPLLTLHIH